MTILASWATVALLIIGSGAAAVIMSDLTTRLNRSFDKEKP